MRTVRRRGTARDSVLDGVPDELAQALLEYAGTTRAAMEARSRLSTALTRHRMSWLEADKIMREIVFG